MLDNQPLTETTRKSPENPAAFLRVSHCVLRNFTPHNNEKREVKRLRTRGEKHKNTRCADKARHLKRIGTRQKVLMKAPEDMLRVLVCDFKMS